MKGQAQLMASARSEGDRAAGSTMLCTAVAEGKLAPWGVVDEPIDHVALARKLHAGVERFFCWRCGKQATLRLGDTFYCDEHGT